MSVIGNIAKNLATELLIQAMTTYLCCCVHREGRVFAPEQVLLDPDRAWALRTVDST